METIADIFSKVGKSMNLFSVDNKEDNLDFLGKPDSQLMQEDWEAICKDLGEQMQRSTN